MINPELFYKILKKNDIDFFIGVPDSILKGFNNYLTGSLKDKEHVIAANEGGAVAIAAGYHLATGKVPLVYLQNSGQGNAVNPLVSLTHRDVYSIPVLLLIGWRGEPDIKDEPQHMKQGSITPKLNELLDIPYKDLSSNAGQAKKDIAFALNYLKKNKSPYALLVRKNFFEGYKMHSGPENKYPLTRKTAIADIVSSLGSRDIVVSTTGKISRELFDHRGTLGQTHDRDFLTVGSMGHSSQISLGIALARPDKKVVCLDGDGAAIMHLGGLSIIGRYKPRNLLHIILNNESHESVGGQPTSALTTNFVDVALACGYKKALMLKNSADIKKEIKKFRNNGPVMLEVKINRQSDPNLGRPTLAPKDLKIRFQKYNFGLNK